MISKHHLTCSNHYRDVTDIGVYLYGETVKVFPYLLLITTLEVAIKLKLTRKQRRQNVCPYHPTIDY